MISWYIGAIWFWTTTFPNWESQRAPQLGDYRIPNKADFEPSKDQSHGKRYLDIGRLSMKVLQVEPFQIVKYKSHILSLIVHEEAYFRASVDSGTDLWLRSCDKAGISCSLDLSVLVWNTVCDSENVCEAENKAWSYYWTRPIRFPGPQEPLITPPSTWQWRRPHLIE
jgi:hypothetical protein